MHWEAWVQIPVGETYFFFAEISCLLLGSTKPPVVIGVLFVGEQRAMPELPSSCEVKNKRRYIHLMAWAGKTLKFAC
jgi:hypothetical protein